MNNETHEKTNDHYVKMTVRDSVFGDLFGNRKYLLRLYQTLHPEDETIREEDFTDITIRNVLINDIYNDLGCIVRGKLIILCECQTLWTVNIILRSLFYMARSLQLYLKDRTDDLYSKRKIDIPKPELYVIYIGDEIERPAQISLSDEFFSGEDTAIDVKVKVIQENDSSGIAYEYIVFSKIYEDQKRLHGRTREAITETIRICKNRDILKEYLASREKEVVDIMMSLFDDQELYEIHFRNLERECMERGEKIGMERGEINMLIEDSVEFGQTKEATIARLSKRFDMSTEEARRIVEEKWPG